MTNYVYIATSLDGLIADKNDGLTWLDQLETPDLGDYGFAPFMEKIDALIMGSTTYEMVLSFGVDWPYAKPVFVLSTRLTDVPEELVGKVEFVRGDVREVIEGLQARGFNDFYVDGGRVIQDFLRADLIDEMILSTFPVLLGGGVPLFGELAAPLWFETAAAGRYGEILVTHYVRKR